MTGPDELTPGNDETSGNRPLEAEQILEVLPHRYPLILVDRILTYEPGKSIVGLKNVSMNEPFFQGHFPGHPIMPGVLIIESMAQVGAIQIIRDLDRKPPPNIFFRRIDRAKFRKAVLPGHTLINELVLLKQRGSLWLFKGKATVGMELVASAELEASVHFP